MINRYIYESASMPKNLFHGRSTIVKHQPDLGAILHYERQKLARQMVEAILSSEEFFTFDPKNSDFTVSTSIDAVVLTVREYQDLCETKFKQGMDAALTYSPLKF